MTTPLQPDDRRNLGMRLSAIQLLVAGIFALLVVAFWTFQVAQHQKFREIAENNHRRRLPLPAPRGVLFDRHGKVLVENQNTRNIALVREQSGNIEQTLHVLALATGADEAKHARDGQPAAARAELPSDRAHRERQPSAGRGVPREKAGAARDHRAGRAGASVSVERDRRAPDWLRQRGQRNRSDEDRVCRRGVGLDGRQGRRRAVVQPAPHGQGRRQDRRRQQPRARDGGRQRDAARRRTPRAADDRRGRPASDRGRLPPFQLQRRRRHPRSAQRRSAGVHELARLQPESSSPAGSTSRAGTR